MVNTSPSFWGDKRTTSWKFYHSSTYFGRYFETTKKSCVFVGDIMQINSDYCHDIHVALV